MSTRSVGAIALALTSTLALASACGGDNKASNTKASSTTAAATSAPSAAGSGLVGSVSTAGISADRCAANKAAGKITYLSGFDFAATASVVEVVMAKEKGYFDAMCLDVDLKSSFSTANYPLVAAGRAQFASGGNYSEVLTQSQGGAKFSVVVDDGKTGIDALLVKPDAGVSTPADLKGKTIGVLGTITPAVKAMLFKAGLVEGKDYKTVLLDGFDPVAHFQQPIAGRPGYKSNEPGILQRAGVPFTLFDPAAQGIPGSFGIIYTSQDFLAAHPTAVQDFVRASMKGLADAIADPTGAVAACVKLIDTAGNQNHLTTEGETFRWQTESKIVVDGSKGQPLGLVDPAQLQAEVDAYRAAGVFESPVSMDGTYDGDLVAGVYGPDNQVVWPTSS
jgi:ABC-type nitrate/sulfonate/bicarbonate transport system substrate-binding protein